MHRSAGRVQRLIGGEASSAAWITPTGRGGRPRNRVDLLEDGVDAVGPANAASRSPVRSAPGDNLAQRGATVAWISTPRL